MIKDIRQHDIEEKVRKAREGFASIKEETTVFAFGTQKLGRAEVVDRFQKGLALFEEERKLQAAYRGAVEARKQGTAELKRFHQEALGVAQKHYGSDAEKMASFGATSPERAKRRRRRSSRAVETEVVTEIIEEVITVSPPPGLPEHERSSRREEETHCHSRVSRGQAGRRR